jgi:dihydroorotate dehydrogenase (fumarate)
MTDLGCTWLGLELASPLVVGACPLSDDVAQLQACVDAGAAAVVMRSLFEEQLVDEQLAAHRFIDSRIDSDAEARSFFPGSELVNLGSHAYLERLKLLQQTLSVPVIASLNGVSPGGWTQHARELEAAGAAAIELNLYDVASPGEDAASLERRQLEVVRSVVAQVSIPVSVKLSAHYSALPAFIRSLQDCGARGVVLFNRFYQPDVDLDNLQLRREIRLSTSSELNPRLQALAMLYGHNTLDLALTGGVHTGDDAAKALLCGANAVQVVSAVLQRGPKAIADISAGLQTRLTDMGYRSLAEARGVLSLRNAPNPREWERLNYARLLRWGAIGSTLLR